MLLATAAMVFAEGFTLKSDAISGQIANAQVFSGFGCSGENISPALSWESAPEGTKSFAITMYDKDAPTGSGWWHWVVFNLPADTTTLPRNSGKPELGLMPKGVVQSQTSFGPAGYGGPCPPVGHGPHQYVFTIHALNVEKLDLDEKASPALVGYMLNAHTIQKASVIGYYGR
jgi:Raf kinase inhibitor-like YbhB/YbcL family protein